MARELVSVEQLAENYELYARNFLKIANKAGAVVPLVFNAPQQKIHRAVQFQEEHGKPVRIVILKSRRVGASTYVQGRNYWRTHLKPHQRAITLAHDADSATDLFGMQQTFNDNMPTEGPLAVKKRHHTTRLIQFQNRSVTKVVVVGKGSARGSNVNEAHASEAAFWTNPERAMTSLKQSVPKLPHTGVFIESTPFGVGNSFHRQWLDASLGRSDYIAVFIAWYDDPSCWDADGMDPADYTSHEHERWGNEQDLIRIARKYGTELQPGQLAWRRNTIANECDGDLQRFLQEYASDDETCFLQSGRRAIDQGLEYQLDNAPPKTDVALLPPSCTIEFAYDSKEEGRKIVVANEERKVAIVEVPRGELRIYAPPAPRHKYISGSDPSEGDRLSDPSTTVMFNQCTMGVDAVLYTRLPPEIHARYAMAMSYLYNRAEMIWESNNHGYTFGNEVNEHGYPNVYFRQTTLDSVAGKITDKMGFWSSTPSKLVVLNGLRKYCRMAPEKMWPPIQDPNIVHELPAWVYEGALGLVPDGAIGWDGKGHHGDGSYGLGLCIMAHRGSGEAALEPLPLETVRRAYDMVGWKRELGLNVTPEDLLGVAGGVTCEDIEKFDLARENAERARRANGIGRMR